MEFKNKIRAIREKRFLSQEIFAKELGVSFATVNRWESGKCLPNYRAKKLLHDYCHQNGIGFHAVDND